MKKKLLALSLAGFLAFGAVSANAGSVNGSFPSGSNGQIQFNNSGVMDGLTIGQTLTNTSGTLNVAIPSDRDVTTATDTILSTDSGKTIVIKNQAGTAFTLPPSSTTGFGQGFGFVLDNKSVGSSTITTTGLIDQVKSLTVLPGESCPFRSDGVGVRTSLCNLYSHNPTFSTDLSFGKSDARFTITNTSTISCSYFSAPNTQAFTSAGGCAGRQTYSAVDGSYLGVVVEPQRTNLFKYSVVSNTTGWVASNGGTINTTTTFNGLTVPIVTYTASAGSGAYVLTANKAAITNGTRYTFSVPLKYVSGSNLVQVGSDENSWSASPNYATMTVNTQTCTRTSSASGIESYSVTAYGEGCLVRITAVAGVDDSGANFSIFRGTASEGAVAVGDVQMEVGGDATSRIRTTGAQQTRYADTIDYINPYWLSGSTGTLCLTFTPKGITSGMRVFSDATTNKNMLYFASATNPGTLDGTNTATYGGVTFAAEGSQNKVCIKYGGTSSNVAINGTLGTAATFDGDFGLSSVKIFRDYNDANNTYGYLSDMVWYNYEISDSEMVTKTTP